MLRRGRPVPPDTGSLRLGEWCPAEANRDGLAVILTLGRELLASVIEPKDLIVKVEERDNQVNRVGVGQAIAHLGVHLGVWIEIVVPIRPPYSCVCAIGEIVEENVCVIV